MTTQAVSSSTASGATAASSATTSQTLVNKDDFLKILVAELKNQDPLDPMKPDQFLSQLSQLEQVEELQNIQTAIENMQKLASTNSQTQWVSAIGKKMGVNSSTLSKGDQVDLKPQGDYDKIVLTLTSVKDGTTQTVNFSQGDELVYTNNSTGEVTVSVQAFKDSTSVSCTAEVYRVIQGVAYGDSGVVLSAGNGDTYTTDKVTKIKG